MNPIRIRKTIDSDTLHIPELGPFVGRTVEIVIAEAVDTPRDQFYAEAARFPETEADFAAQKETFRGWRADPRFEAYWPVLDRLIAREYAEMRKWAAVEKGLQEMRESGGYDYDAWREQREFDLKHAHDHLP
jgi:hypothetical protein